MKKIILAISFLMVFSNIVAQKNYSGKIIDQQKEPIAFANIVAYKKIDNTLITGVISDDEGAFKIKSNTDDIYLEVSFVGFKNQKITPVKENLGTIILEEEGLLDEVVITARKKMIEQKVDRLVFNVENSIASQGMGGVDLLQKTPMLSFDETQGLSIIGKGNVRVMINGRILNLSGRELTSYLQSIQSDNIKKIEVITTPPSKYDAEGNSGLINIILKKNTNLGFSGSLNATLERNSLNGFRTGATLNYQSGGVTTSLRLNQYDIGFNPKGTNDFITAKTSILSSSERLDDVYGTSLDYDLNYQLNEQSNIGIIYNYSKSHYDMNSNNKSSYVNQQALDSTLVTNSLEKSKFPRHTITAYYDVKLDSIGKKINIEGNYYGSKSDRNSNFKTDVNAKEKNVIRGLSNVQYDIYSGKLDLTLPYTWGTFEMGAKYTTFKNDSDIKYLNRINQDYIVDFEKSNVFNYNENNYALYTSFHKNIDEKWSYKLGARYEYTTLKGGTPQRNDEVKNNYGKFFPSIYVSYKANKQNIFSVNYSKRIKRPTFRDLNPYRWYSNPYRYFAGNPTLRPSYSDNIELSYSFKNKLTFKLYNEYGTDKSTNIDRLNDGVYSNILENAFDDNKTGLTISYFNRFFKIWELSTTANTYYVKTYPKTQGLISMNTFSTYFSANNSVALNHNKTLFFNLNFWYSSPRVVGNFKLEDMYELAPGLRASFLDKKLNFNLVFNDVLRSIKNDGQYRYTNRQTNFSQYNDYRKVSLSISYAFGNKKVKRNSKVPTFDERNRAN